MEVLEYFVLYTILTTFLLSRITGNESNLVLHPAVTGEFTLLCKTATSVRSIRWTLNGEKVALFERKGPNCSRTSGNDNRFRYKCNEDEFQLTVPSIHLNYTINGSKWACKDPHGRTESNTLTIFVAGSAERGQSPNRIGSAEEGELPNRIDPMKKWLVLTSSVAAVFVLATVVLVAEKIKKNGRVVASFKENGSIKRNTDNVPGPSTLKYTGSYRENSMYIPSDLNTVPDRENAMPLPSQNVDDALQNRENKESLLSYNDDITNTMAPNKVSQYDNGAYSYAVARDSRMNKLL